MNYSVEDGRDDLPMFIHSEIDDLGLDVFEFRVYARLARRAGRLGVCTESVKGMAEACKISRRKLIDCLRSLEKRGMVVCESRATQGETSIYRLTPKRDWGVCTTCTGGVHDMHGGCAPHAPKGIPFKEETYTRAREKTLVIFEDEWEKFQRVYPKGAKLDYELAKGTFQAFMMASEDLSVIIEGARLYAEHCKREHTQPRFIKTPNNWLREKGWLVTYPGSEPKPKKKLSYDPETVFL